LQLQFPNISQFLTEGLTFFGGSAYFGWVKANLSAETLAPRSVEELVRRSGLPLSASELLALAIWICPDTTFDPQRAQQVLGRRGLLPKGLTLEHLIDAAEASPAYQRSGDTLHLVRPAWASEVLGRVWRRAKSQRRLSVSKEPASGMRPLPARVPKKKPAPVPKKKSQSGVATRRCPTASRAPSATPVEVLILQEASPLELCSTRAANFDAEAISAMLSSESTSLERISLALRAHALSSADRFHELMGVGSLRGVVSHAYQIETVRKVLRVFRGRALLADEVGLGKTVEALMILREYQLRGMARKVLILAPAALVNHWVGELTDKGGLEVRATTDVLFRRDTSDFWREPGIVVASLALARTARHMPELQQHGWDLVIVDEAHHVKNRTTASYALVNGLRSRFLLLLTATPVETGLDEIYNLVTLIKPGQFASPAAFRKQFVDLKDPSSLKNRERLRALLQDVMVRNTRAQCGLKLPPRFVTTVAVEPTEEERQLYGEVLSVVREHGQESRTRMLASTLLLEAGCSPKALLGTLSRVADSELHSGEFRANALRLAELARSVKRPSKHRCVLEILASNTEQALIFTRFRAAADELAAALIHADIPCTMFHGGLSAEEKQRAIAGFRGGLRVMVATDVGGEGQNLQFCSLLINFDLPWNPMQIEQRIGRLHRMGQTEPVRVFNLCAKGTAEERLLDILDRRLHLFELVVGEMDMVLGNLADERDLEERVLSLYTASKAEAELDVGFDKLAEELLQARARYQKTKLLDTALFGQDYET